MEVSHSRSQNCDPFGQLRESRVFLTVEEKIICDVLLYPRAWELGFLLGSIINGFRSYMNKIIKGHKWKNVIFWLGNYPPTPPLTSHFAQSEKLA